MDEQNEPAPRMTPVGELLSPTKPTSFGNLFGDTLRIYLRHFLPITLVAATLLIPLELIELAHVRDMHAQPDFWELVDKEEADFTTSWSLLRTPAIFFLTAFVTYIVVQHLRGRRPSLPNAIGVGVARALPSLLVAICIALMVVALMIVAFVTKSGILMLIAIVPTAMLLCALFVAVPASVIERPGIMGALSRSCELTKGCRWLIFGANLLVLIGIGLVASRIEESLLGDVTRENFMERVETYTWFGAGLNIVMCSLMAVFCAVTYHSLRTNHDGIDSDTLASVFD